MNDRISLVLDAAAFAKAGLAEVSSALSLLEHFTGETDGENPAHRPIFITDTVSSFRMVEYRGSRE